MIRAMIFDLDGTLIDTEKYYRICWPKAFAHFGYHMTDQQVLSLRSLGRPFAPAYLKEISGDPAFDYEQVRAYRKGLFEQCLKETGLELKPGAKELLDLLKEKGILRAVATATDPERAGRYLKDIGLYNYFDQIISASMVKEGKPSPDIYQYAFDQLKESLPDLKKEECYGVEDSPNGAKSACGAGLPLIYIPDQTPADREIYQLTQLVYPSLRKVAEEIEKECFPG